MFAFIGNRGDLARQILERHRPLLSIQRGPRDALGWGIGFYQSGEVLLRRRPIDERPSVNLADGVDSIRTDALIGHVRHATTGAFRTENTHPFRYRLWLFAHTGEIAGFARLRDRLLDSLPKFLKRNVRGDTDSEVFFYLFLSFLHDAGHLEESRPQPRSVTGALRATLSLLDRFSAEEGFGPNRGDVLVSNGEELFAVHRDGNMATIELDGRLGVEELLSQGADPNMRIPSVESTHFSLVASGLDAKSPEWTPVQGRSIVTFSRSHAPHIEPL
jgi:glutamine amidotransferase